VKKKMNWVRLLIGLILIGGAVTYFLGDGSETPVPVAQTKKTATPFDKLTPQQQQYVRDTYRLADRLFKEGRYEMARQEVTKIHQLVPVYEESKNLEKLAEVAIQTQLDQQRAEAQEKEKAEMDEKIRRTVAQCRTKISSKIEMKTIDDCLSPVIALNPEHADILALKSQVDQIIAARLQSQEKQAEYQALLRRQKGLFDKAVALKQAGKPLEALVAYDDVVKSKLPDPQNYKLQSKQEIASIQQDLATKQGELEKTANDQSKAGNLKGAITTLKQAIEINPENEVLKGRVNSMLGELKKQMQVLYQEGVLEESVGEVETAKTKWKKIIEQSLPEEDYYKKARSKIKKYEAE
jgi:tetratricopeptide (TPR) repeat protein